MTEHTHRPGEVFVFGSNLTGMHLGGAALTALRDHGAIPGHGVGRQGTSYAIPTMDASFRPLTVGQIAPYASYFVRHAMAHPSERFFLTAVATGIAGHKAEDIAPLFVGCPDNVRLPIGWREMAGA